MKRAIDPLLIESRVVLANKNFRDELCKLSQWTHSTADLLEIYDDVCDNSVLSVLRITSILEFALGNVYQTITHRAPPHLLKDLLQELIEVGGLFRLNQVIC